MNKPNISSKQGKLDLITVKEQQQALWLKQSQDLLDTGLAQLKLVQTELNSSLTRSPDAAAQAAMYMMLEASQTITKLIMQQSKRDGDGRLVPKERIDLIYLVGEVMNTLISPAFTVQEMATGLQAAAQRTRAKRSRADIVDLMATRAVRMVNEYDFSGISFKHTVIGYCLAYSLSIRTVDTYEQRTLELALGFARDALEGIEDGTR